MQKISCKEKIDQIVKEKYDDISCQLRNRFKQRFPSVDRCKDEIFGDAYVALLSSDTISNERKDPDLITEGYIRQSLFLNSLRDAKKNGYLGYSYESLEDTFEQYLSEENLENDIIFADYIDHLSDDEKQLACLLIQGYSLNEIWNAKIFKSRFKTDNVFAKLKQRLSRDFNVGY